MRRLPSLLLVGFVLLSAGMAGANSLGKVANVLDRAHMAAGEALSSESVPKYRRALTLYRMARDLLKAPGLDPAKLSKDAQSKRDEYMDSIRSGISMCEQFLKDAGQEMPEESDDKELQTAIEPLPPRKEGQQTKKWVRAAIDQYHEADDPRTRAAYAQRIVAEAGMHALDAMLVLFKTEDAPKARDGVHEALATLGTSRVANAMKASAKKDRQVHWRNALDVIYRCVRKPETTEKERPFQRAVRAFHWLQDEPLSTEIIETFDKMGKEGVAALGEVLFTKNVGCHDRVIGLLATKKDGRAVPPLVFLMNRFKFDKDMQVPAHEALLKLEWYAVPELINRLDDKAAGIWISWTLRKISGEHMGTDKRKWHDWWKTAKKDHPEATGGPEERFGPATPDR